MCLVKGVWVLIEHKDEKLQDGSLELVCEGRKIADKMKEELTAAEIIKRLRADGSSFEECVIALLQAIIENSKPEAINDTSKRDESVIKNLHAKLLEKGLNEEQCSFLVNSVWGELSLVDYRGATN